MAALLASVAPVAAGRGENPSDAGGVLIIAGVVLAFVVLVAVGALLLRSRAGRRRSDVFRRRPARRGRIGRIW